MMLRLLAILTSAAFCWGAVAQDVGGVSVGTGGALPLDGKLIVSAGTEGTLSGFPVNTSGYASILISPTADNQNGLAVEGSNDYDPAGPSGNGKWVGLSCSYPNAPSNIVTTLFRQADVACANTYLWIRVRIQYSASGGETKVYSVLRNTQVPATFASTISVTAATSSSLSPVSAENKNSLLAKGSSGNLYSVSGSTGDLPTYIMALNQPATMIPADGQVPICGQGAPNTEVQTSPCILGCWGLYPPKSPFSLNYSPGPALQFQHGLWLVASSTGCSVLTLTDFRFLSASIR